MSGFRFIVATLLLSATACTADDETAKGDDAVADSGGDDEGEATAKGSDGGSDAGGDDRPMGETDSMVLVDGWLYDEADPAPFTDPPPDPVMCDVGWGVEDGVFEVDSGLCNWGVFTQPSLVDIHEGDLVEVILLYDTLYSEDPEARAHLGAALGETMVWETMLMIPAPAGFIRPTWTADADYPAGTPVRLHIHNHGYNNYRVVDITVTGQ